jgi:hypothetical protein
MLFAFISVHSRLTFHDGMAETDKQSGKKKAATGAMPTAALVRRSEKVMDSQSSSAL